MYYGITSASRLPFPPHMPFLTDSRNNFILSSKPHNEFPFLKYNLSAYRASCLLCLFDYRVFVMFFYILTAPCTRHLARFQQDRIARSDRARARVKADPQGRFERGDTRALALDGWSDSRRNGN